MSRGVGRWFAANGAATGLLAVAWSKFAHVREGYWPTLLFLLATAAIGLVMIYRTSARLDDPRLLRLGYLFIGALALTLLILGPRWQNEMLAGGTALQGDQERFYIQAGDFAREGFRVESLPSLNYTGVLFIYGAVFAVFGHNPYAPEMLNALAVLAATLLVVRVGYKIKRERSPSDWTIGLCFVIPEVLLHGTMASRDILAMALLTISVLSVATHLLDDGTKRRTVVAAFTMTASLLLLAIVRTTAVIPAVASIVLLLFLHRAWRSLAFVAIPAIAILLAAPLLSEHLGGYHLSYARVVANTVVDPNEQVLDIFNWHPRSIGRLFVSHTPLQAVVFALPRLVLYLLAPLPSPGLSWKAVTAGDWFHTQLLLTVLSSVLYATLFPLALASLRHVAVACRAGFALHIPFWTTMLAIVSGTPLIHERYRLMAMPLLLGCIWLGRMATMRQIAWSYALWGAVLVAGGGAAAVYKSRPCAVPVVASQPQSPSVVAGEPVTLTVAAAGADLTYQWFGGSTGFTGAPVLGATHASLTISPRVPATYWLRISNPCGVVDSGTAVITIK